MPRVAPKTREDLEYVEQDADGDQVILVHDPIRGAYFRFNALQGAMLRALDGRRTAAEITAVLSEQFEVEIPPEAAERFIARARDLMLLEITSYDATPEKARQRVQKALHKAGFRLRASRRNDASPDGTLMAQAFAELDRGHPRAAAAYLGELLEGNPRNARARQLYDLIQGAYIRATGGMNDFPTFVMFNPSRLLTWLSRSIGGFLFSWRGMVPILLFIALGAYAYTEISFDHVTFGVLDIALAVVFFQLQALFHELGHGLACQHYGGNVTEVGFVLLYGIQPGQYCDTSSSYLITDRRHKMVVQIAGTVVSFVFMSAQAIALAVMRPTLPVYSGIALALIVGLAVASITLIPFLKFDSYYAICDYFGFANLRDRSFKLTRAWLGERLFGLATPTEELPARTRGLLIAYAILSFAFTTWFIYFALFRMLTPLVERFRGPGLVFALVVAGLLLRRAALRPLWAFLRVVVRERRRIFTRRRTASLLAVTALVVGPWFIRWPVLVDAAFVVAPRQRADVRAQTTGRVAEVLVKEGDRVTRGQPLATLRDAGLHARVEQATAELDAASHRVGQLRAGARSEELALARSRLERARSEVRRSDAEAQVASRLAQASLATEASAEAARGRASSSAGTSGAMQWAFALLEAGARREDIAAAEADRARIESQLEHLRAEQALLTLRSPIDGVVATPHLEDKLQVMMKPGDLFAEVHDQSAVVAEIALTMRDPLAEIAIGDEVELRPYGAPDGEVRARVERFREVAQDTAGERQIIGITAPFALDRPITGLTGHARIYGAERSLAYANLYLPLQRLVRVRLWSMWR
jgi:multidrug resistance efflux pump